MLVGGRNGAAESGREKETERERNETSEPELQPERCRSSSARADR